MSISDDDKKVVSAHIYRLWSAQQASLREFATFAGIEEGEDENIEDVVHNYATCNSDIVSDRADLFGLFAIAAIAEDMVGALVILTTDLWGERWYEKYPISEEEVSKDTINLDTKTVMAALSIINKQKTGEAQ